MGGFPLQSGNLFRDFRARVRAKSQNKTYLLPSQLPPSSFAAPLSLLTNSPEPEII